MRMVLLVGIASLLGSLACSNLVAQERLPNTPAAAPNANAVAATVNGQPIRESAVQRGLQRVPPERRTEARADILEYLIDNLLIEQYLVQHKLDVPKKDLDARVEQIREEIKKQGGTFEKVMQELALTEDELRSQVTADLRWDIYINAQATDKVLRDLFDKNPEMFDGTMVRARHILLTPPAGNAAAAQEAQAQLRQLRQQIEQRTAAECAKLPAGLDNLAKERARTRLIEDSFIALAKEKSTCPSKEQGGDLGWFPRAGSMVEAFAKAAFALKPYEMSEVIATKFGLHLILLTDRRDGKPAKFEEVKELAKEIYSDQLRELFVAHLRPKAQIAMSPAPKP
jgi:parvulin-like peptidyl-prolyl isomerase